MSRDDIVKLMQKTEEWITPELRSVFDEKAEDDITVQAATYSLFAGGKRLRPMMMMLTSEMLRIDRDIDADVKMIFLRWTTMR